MKRREGYMQQEKISVIVPIYNVEKYLKRCINSLLKQNYENYEIILVDDGSSDDCPDICDEYANKYEKIRVIHKKNGGLSDARNTGVENCNSDYVIFVDSDDYVESDMLLLLWSAKKKYKADIVCTPLIYEYPNGVKKYPQKFENFVTDFETAQAGILRRKYSGASACAKLLPVEILKKYPYPKNELMEDLQIIFWHIGEAKRVAFISSYVYHYVQRNNSISYSDIKIKNIIKTIKIIKQIINTTKNVQVKNAAISGIFDMVAYYSASQQKILRKNRKKLQRILKKYIFTMLKDPENSRVRKIKFILLAGNMITFNVYRFLQWFRRKFSI